MIQKKLRRGLFDIFHPTFYGIDFLKQLNGKPFVLTIFDMIHENFPEMFPGDSTPQRKKLLAMRASKIIAISENTRQDILQRYEISPEKVTTIHLGYTQTTAVTPMIPREDYLLYVGTRDLYKNFQFCIKAIAPVIKKHHLHLLCAGGGAFTSQEQLLIHSLGIGEHVLHQSPTDTALASLYAGARAFVYPSLYEGFGIPIVEAFTHGCPVLLSNASCFPEIAGHAAAYFNPTDMHSLQTTVEQVITDEHLRKSMIVAGKQRAHNYSWADCARQTIEVYKSVR